ncbi:MAG: porphobilinogen synthase [Thermovirgaceae bacterium]
MFARAESSSLSPKHLILPLFVTAGDGRRIPSETIEGVERASPDQVPFFVERALSVGVRNFVLFGHYEKGKDRDGTPASDPEGPVQEALRLLTKNFKEADFFTHVSLAHATDNGLNFCIDPSGTPDAQKTRRRFLETAESHLDAGAKGVIPLFLEKGFVRLLRTTMDARGFSDRAILSYGAKFDSALYGPFNASTSITERGMPSGQIHPSDEGGALLKAASDIREGTSALIIKPALAYLDIIAKFHGKFDIPLTGWLVSGEYMMIRTAAKKGVCDERRTIVEVHRSLFRAGADRVITYDAVRLAGWLLQES